MGWLDCWTAPMLLQGPTIPSFTHRCPRSTVSVLQFPYAATEQLKQHTACTGCVILISTVQTDPTVLLLLFLPLRETQSTLQFQSMVCNVMYWHKLRYRLWLELHTHCEPGAMQSNGKRDNLQHSKSELHGWFSDSTLA